MTSDVLRSKLALLKKSGELSFHSQKMDIESTLKTPEVKKSTNFIKTLTLTRTNFSTANGIPEMPFLTTLNADNSKLENFENFLAFPKLAKVNIKKTPVSEKKNFKLSLYLLFGESLSSINGSIISETVRAKASEYPEYARELVNKGWIAVYPPPSDEDFEEICKNYGVDIEETASPDANSQSAYGEEDKESQNSDESNENDDEYQYIIQELRDRQEEQLREAAEYLGFEEEEEEEEENDEVFAYNVAGLFLDHGIDLGPASNEDILKAVEDVCKKATKAH